MLAYQDRDMKRNGKHHQDNTTWKNELFTDRIFHLKKCFQLTLPHDDFCTGTSEVFSPASSSAKPQEQSLQAFRLPVVPQTVGLNE